ncbi:hypothetical protein [Lentzea sp. NPDC055074]
MDDLLARDVEELHQEIAELEGKATLMHALGCPGRVEMPRSVTPDGRRHRSQDVPAARVVAWYRERAEQGDTLSARRLAELLEMAGQHTESAAWWQRAADLGDQDAVAYLAEVGTRH